jgi:hypothetical protein
MEKQDFGGESASKGLVSIHKIREPIAVGLILRPIHFTISKIYDRPALQKTGRLAR